jgi:nitroimidazol reductase NimA-like FMN-containing flavoprotein (pyridoxamine 5'-phosphate oxidase superfamily)
VALSRTECTRLLARNHVGRLAFAFRGSIDIVPIHYAYADGWIYARTSPGQKIAKLRHNRWVAFEVDEIHGMFMWASVVVHGALYLLDAESTISETWERAVAILRDKFPGAFTDRDPVPFRTAIFRIHVDAVSGRRATPSTR